MRKFKRTIAFALLLLVLAGMLPLQAFAEEDLPTEPTEVESAEPVFGEAVYINPLYADVLTEADLACVDDIPMLLADDTYTSVDEAASALAEAMANRQQVVIINLQTKTALTGAHRVILDKAMDHNGIPGQGDNLRYQYAGCKMTYSSSVSGGTYYYYAKYTMTYMTTAAQEEKLALVTANLRQQLGLSSMTDVEKITAVYNWMCDNISYDYAGLDDSSDLLEYTAYDALINRSAVCQGYANLFYYIMLQEGIDCRIISGTSNGGPHAWNIVRIDGYYYNVDATWDVNWRGKYFLRGSANFNKDHIPGSDYTAADFVSAYPIDTADYTAPTRSGSCGASATWHIDNTGKLTISGSGAMTDYTSDNDAPWSRFYTSINEVVVEDGITHIGDRAFQWLSVKSATLGKDVATLGDYAFGSCHQLKTIYMNDSLTSVGRSAFYDCTALTTVIYCGSAAQWKIITVDSSNTALTAANRKYHDYAKGVCNVCGYQDPDYLELMILTQPVSVAVMPGQTASVTVQAQGNDLTYAWYYTTDGTGTKFYESSNTTATYSVVMDATRAGRRVYCVITDKYGSTVTTDTVTLSEKESPPIIITRQPESVSVESGQTAAVTVQAQGEGLTYTWYFANKGSAKFSKSSLTGNTYTAEMDETRDGRRVYCVITDMYGKTATTETVTLKRYVPFKILSQPSSLTVIYGQKAQATLDVCGEGLTYRWYYRNKDAKTFSLSTACKGKTYSMVMNDARDGRQVYCVITDKYGSSIVSNLITLNQKKKEPLILLAQPAAVTAAYGASAGTEVEATGDGLTYTWYYANKGKTKFTKSSTKTSTYTAVMDEVRDGRRIYCIITDAYGNKVKTETVTMLVDRTALRITQQPQNVTAPKGAIIRSTVAAEGDGLKYTWYFTSGGTATKFSKSSVTGASYSTTMDAARNGRKVYCIITDAYGNKVKTNTAILSMEQPAGTPLKIVTQPASVTVAGGKTAKATVVAQGDGLTYTWYYTSNGSATKFYKSGTTTATYSTTMDSSRDGRKIYCVITDAYGNTVTTNTVTLKMG